MLHDDVPIVSEVSASVRQEDVMKLVFQRQKGCLLSPHIKHLGPKSRPLSLTWSVPSVARFVMVDSNCLNL